MRLLRYSLGVIASRFANRRFVFALAAVSIIASKGFHVYAHRAALSTADLLHWGLSFFASDVASLLFLRLILFAPTHGALSFILTLLSAIFVVIVTSLASINISFFVVAGSELHWRNIALAGDSSSWGYLMTGLFSLGMTLGALLIASWIIQDSAFVLSSIALDIVKFPLMCIYNRLPSSGRQPLIAAKYNHIPQDDVESVAEKDEMRESFDGDSRQFVRSRRLRTWLAVFLYLSIGVGLLFQFITYFLQPRESSFIFLTCMVPLLPFLDFASSSPNLSSVLPLGSSAHDFGNSTALGQPPKWKWLPAQVKNLTRPGFEDWYEPHATHYRADRDPLKIDNLNDPLLSELRDVLPNIDIRHIMLVKLESTRKDVFPLRSEGYIWNKLQDSWENKTLPEEAKNRLANLTPMANYITGDYDDGFEHPHQKKRGGINVKNAHTTSTYTLKSLPGTLCGITPVVGDFNLEWNHHVYQPCLAQIFDLLNDIDHRKDEHDDHFSSYKWRTSFMQSTTGGYDKQDLTMANIGYPGEKFVQGEYLKSKEATHPESNVGDVSVDGMPEVPLTEYIRDMFIRAKKEKERVFLAHLTSTTHHPFVIPEDEHYVQLNEDGSQKLLSEYTNAVGYVDKWLSKVLGVLDEQGVANETLIVFVGDHGLSIAENGAVTPYYQPNIGNFHVPLVFSHPHLPAMNLDDVASSIHILPTILDLLLETKSMSKSEGAAIKDLIRNYEGQSFLRPLRTKSKGSPGEGAWQFTVMNTGGAQIAVRDARRQDWRIVVPLVDNTAWRFSHPGEDTHEEDPILDFGFPAFKTKVEAKYGVEAGEWVEEAAYITRWYVKDNARRWHYNP